MNSFNRVKRISEIGLRTDFLDSCLFTCKFPKVEDTCPTYLTFLIDLDFLQGRHVYRKDTFYPYGPRHFSDSKGFRTSFSPSLDNYSLKKLDTGFFAFPNLIIDRDGIPGRKSGKIFFWNKFVFDKFNQ